MTDNTVDVWDLKGAKHTVTRANANDFVTHLGWTRKSPIVAAAAPAAAREPEAAPPAQAKPVDPVDLTQMSREGLVRFAQEHFGMTFDANVSAEAILNAILTEQTS